MALLYLLTSLNPYPVNVENMVSSNNASKWQMGFNLAFKGLNTKISSCKDSVYQSQQFVICCEVSIRHVSANV
jgi:hypothetical protein